MDSELDTSEGPFSRLMAKTASRQAKVAVIALGYADLPLALYFVEAGSRV